MRPKMNESKCDKVSIKYTIITVSGITLLMPLMLEISRVWPNFQMLESKKEVSNQLRQVQ